MLIVDVNEPSSNNPSCRLLFFPSAPMNTLLPLLEAKTVGTRFSIALHHKTATMLSDAVVRPNHAKLLRFINKFAPLFTIPLTTADEKMSKQIGAENSMFS